MKTRSIVIETIHRDKELLEPIELAFESENGHRVRIQFEIEQAEYLVEKLSAILAGKLDD